MLFDIYQFGTGQLILAQEKQLFQGECKPMQYRVHTQERSCMKECVLINAS